jgi:hypothetical protein
MTLKLRHKQNSKRDQKDCYFFNVPVRFWLRSKMHPLVEHQKRLHLINLLQDPESSPLTRFSLEELYEQRDQL